MFNVAILFFFFSNKKKKQHLEAKIWDEADKIGCTLAVPDDVEFSF